MNERGMGMRVDVLDDPSSLAALRPAWDALWDNDPTADVFSTFDWFDNWWTHFGHGERDIALEVNTGAESMSVSGGDWCLHVCVVREAGGEAVAVLPLVRLRGELQGRKRRILSTAVNGHSPRAGIVASRFDAEVVAALCLALRSDARWDVLLLDGLPEADGRFALVAAELGRHGLPARSSGIWHHSYMSYEGSWAGRLKGRSHKFRLHLGQNERSLVKLGALTLDRLTGDDAATRGFDSFLAVDRASWKARDGEVVEREPELQSYYRGLVRRMAARGRAEIWLLQVADQLAAAFICLRDGRSLYTVKTSFSEHFGSTSRLSPSQVLLAKIIESSWGEQAHGIDFVGKRPFVDRWSDRQLGFSHWLVERRRFDGLRLRAGDLVSRWLTTAREGTA